MQGCLNWKCVGAYAGQKIQVWSNYYDEVFIEYNGHTSVHCFSFGKLLCLFFGNAVCHLIPLWYWGSYCHWCSYLYICLLFLNFYCLVSIFRKSLSAYLLSECMLALGSCTRCQYHCKKSTVLLHTNQLYQSLSSNTHQFLWVLHKCVLCLSKNQDASFRRI